MTRPGHRGERAAQVLRRQGRARRHRPGRPRRDDLRPARPERRRQDHRRQDPLHPRLRRPRLRRDPRRRSRPGRRPAGGPRRDRRHRAVLRRRRADHRRGEHAPHGGPAPPLQARGTAGRPPNCWSASTWWRRPKKPASTYSGGMKRRLDIAMTLVGGPRIIFLDEPTTGLDPRRRHTMWQIIRELVTGGVTVFLTTQYLEEADELADRIAVLERRQDRRRGHRRGAQAAHPRRPRAAALHRPGRLPERRLRPAPRSPATTRRWRCRSPATAASANCAPSSTGWTPPASRPTN